ncbi:cache domain-containing protein [Geobacter metallireducens]|nr:cache domain-containing protein [Geobacter metallireducens]
MRKVVLVTALITLLSAHLLFAAEQIKPSTAKPEESYDSKNAKEMLARAVELYNKKKDRSFADFSMQGQFVKGNLYVYVIGTNGKFLASGGSSSVLIGRDVSNMRDAEGKLFFREMIDTAKSQNAGAVEYKWLNRLDGKPEHKHTYFQRIGDRIIAVGFYIPHASDVQAYALLAQAVETLKKDPVSACNAFNDLNSKFIQDDLYVFVVDLKDNIFRAHGATPRLVNTDAMELRNPDGKSIVKEMIGIAKKKGKGTLTYRWRNLLTGKIEVKNTIFRKVDNYLIAVGYYTQ